MMQYSFQAWLLYRFVLETIIQKIKEAVHSVLCLIATQIKSS